MHRHGYVGRKLGRKRDDRHTLIKNLATSLILDEHVTTTTPKAKELLPYTERLITKARKGGLHNRRQIISGLLREDAATRLVDEIAPRITRTSGFLRLKKSGFRKGDHSELSTVSFVDDISAPAEPKARKSTSDKPVPAKAQKSAKAKGTKTSAKVVKESV